MGKFSDILLTVDFDRTLTGPDGTIPPRNLEAIGYFMEHGGRFTVNTGRSVALFRKFMDVIPVNAPFLLYNGSAAYDRGRLTDCVPIEEEMWPILDTVHRFCPEQNLEIQGVDAHYCYEYHTDWARFYQAQDCAYGVLDRKRDYSPFLKFTVFGRIPDGRVASLFENTGEDLPRLDEIEAWLRKQYPRMEVFRAAPRIIDVHARGVSKIRAARNLQQKLGRKILVCAGDAENDITMLEGADYGYCPSDGMVADRFPNVCACAEGAVADVIYKKIPEIIDNRLDRTE